MFAFFFKHLLRLLYITHFFFHILMFHYPVYETFKSAPTAAGTLVQQIRYALNFFLFISPVRWKVTNERFLRYHLWDLPLAEQCNLWHVQRRDSAPIGRRMLEMELPGRRPRCRPKRRYMDAVKEDMPVVGVRVEDTKNRVKWKMVIRCGNPWKGTSRKEKKNDLAVATVDQLFWLRLHSFKMKIILCSCIRVSQMLSFESNKLPVLSQKKQRWKSLLNTENEWKGFRGWLCLRWKLMWQHSLEMTWKYLYSPHWHMIS